jgi:Domain of Unknown Function with PDB structure (DUF3857)
MRIIPGRSFIMIVLIAIAISSPAQKEVKKYKEEAAIIRADVWGWQKPEFAIRDIPAQYAGASKVIIARHNEICADSKSKTKSAGKDFGTFRQSYLTEIIREAIKLNDKAAVDEYSEISYTQLLRSNRMSASAATSTYIGVRIIKPDGTIKEVSAEDIVLTKDEKTRKEAKLAIADLQTGDIIDYFLATQQRLSPGDEINVSSNTFLFFDDAPVLFYSVHIEVPKKYAVEYRCYNGAPDFKTSATEESDNVLDLVVKNIPANTARGLWLSPYRQLPLIRLNIKTIQIVEKDGKYTRETGKVYPNPGADAVLKQASESVNYFASSQGKRVAGITSGLSGDMLKYFEQLVNKKKILPLDSLIAELYYVFRYTTFLDVEHYADIDNVVASSDKEFNDKSAVYRFNLWLQAKDIKSMIMLVSSRSGPRKKEILTSGDLNWILLTFPDKVNWMGMSDIFSPCYHLPYGNEYTQQATLEEDGKHDSEGAVTVAGSEPSDNCRVETLDIAPLANGVDLQVNRRTILKGHYKPDVQKKLILFEDYCNAERKLLGASNTIIEELGAVRNKKSYAPELQAAFNQARTKQKDEFIGEAKGWFDQPITDLVEHRIENMGVRHQNPDFIYSSKFTIGGLIKKAGNNMVVDIGKLQGTPLNISAAQRKRQLDIYMPFARSFQAQINFQIPDGYTAEGVSELNKKVENETGYFNAEATSDGKTISIKIKKSYNHAFEPAGNWDKLLAFIDAANDWTNAKLLLKKK